jgi:prolyl-tRNA synthetase
MKGAEFVDSDGQAKPYYMGCYGIGLGRTMATVAELYHDDRGLVWPENLAPFGVQLVSLQGMEEQAERLYQKLTDAGVEILWDDREVSPGQKFADADLIGCPIRLVLSTRNEGKIEWKYRNNAEAEVIGEDAVIERLS